MTMKYKDSKGHKTLDCFGDQCKIDIEEEDGKEIQRDTDSKLENRINESDKKERDGIKSV